MKESFIALPSIIKYYHLQYCTAASTQPLLRSMDQACDLSAPVLGSTASDERSAHWSLHGRRAPLHSPSPCHRTWIQRRVIVCPVCLAFVCITFNHIISYHHHPPPHHHHHQQQHHHHHEDHIIINIIISN